MKNFLKIIFLTVLVVSCNNDDDDSNTPVSADNYFPIHQSNVWNYKSTLNGNITTSFNGTQTVSNYTYNKLLNPEPIFGSVQNPKVLKEGNQYFLDAEYQIGSLPAVSFNHQLFLNDTSTNGQVVNTINSTVNLQSTPVNDPASGFSGSVTPSITLKIVITQADSYNSTTLNASNTTYNGVKKMVWNYYLSSSLKLEGSVNGIIQVNTSHSLISEQLAGNLNSYYANKIGVARSEFNIDLTRITFNTNVQLAGNSIDISSFVQPLITEFSQTKSSNVYELLTYTVN